MLIEKPENLITLSSLIRGLSGKFQGQTVTVLIKIKSSNHLTTTFLIYKILVYLDLNLRL